MYALHCPVSFFSASQHCRQSESPFCYLQGSPQKLPRNSKAFGFTQAPGKASPVIDIAANVELSLGEA